MIYTSLTVNQKLFMGDRLCDLNGEYYLTLGWDGNLTMWANQEYSYWDTSLKTGADFSTGAYAMLQETGDFILCDAQDAILWNSNTKGLSSSPPSLIYIEDDGELVLAVAGDLITIVRSKSRSNFKHGGSSFLIRKLRSPNGQYELIMQADGNLVLYDQGVAFWATGTVGSGATRATMQNDGNLVLYDDNNNAVWATNSNRESPFLPGPILKLQDDRNLVIYHSNADPLWSSNTHLGSLELILENGMRITSENGSYCLIMQHDGNLVLYTKYNAMLWSTRTGGLGAVEARMQHDGNLVLYGPQRQVIWSSNTWGHDAANLVLKDTGDLVIIDRKGEIIWKGFTANTITPFTLVLCFDEKITSPNGKYQLIMQRDGNLVMYDEQSTAIWSSATSGSGATNARVARFGFLELFNDQEQVLWSVGKDRGAPDARVFLNLYDNRNLILSDAGMFKLWTSETLLPIHFFRRVDTGNLFNIINRPIK